MSSELINRISIKKDGVYVSTHSRNDSSPYTSVKIEFLTKAYKEKGLRGLDKEVVDMCFYNCELRGNHKSILPYKEAIGQVIQGKAVGRQHSYVLSHRTGEPIQIRRTHAHKGWHHFSSSI